MADFFPPLETIPDACLGMVWGPSDPNGRDAMACQVAMRAGIFVTNTGSTNYKTVKNFAAITDRVFGVTELLTGMRAPTGDGVNEYGALDIANVVRKGAKIYVLTEAGDTLVPGAAVHVRAIANGGDNVLGAIAAAQDGVNTIAAVGVSVYKTTEVIGGVRMTLLELNLP